MSCTHCSSITQQELEDLYCSGGDWAEEMQVAYEALAARGESVCDCHSHLLGPNEPTHWALDHWPMAYSGYRKYQADWRKSVFGY